MIFFHVADCNPGQYPNPLDTDSCIDCPVGSYKSSSGSAECTICDVNFSTASTGSDSENKCIGTYTDFFIRNLALK